MAKLPTGRPSRLTPERFDAYMDAIRGGNTMKAAARAASLGESTCQGYLDRGRTAQALIDAHLDKMSPRDRDLLDTWPDERIDRFFTQLVSPAERPFWAFWVQSTRASAEAEQRHVRNLVEAGDGYWWTETTEETREVLSKDGDVITLTTVRAVRKFTRNYQASLAWLERRNREDWGTRPAQVEVTGEGGGPIITRPVEDLVAEALTLVDELAERRERSGESKAG